MKRSIVLLLATLFTLPLTGYAEATAEADASGSSTSSSKSVTVTSDGKNTVKRIVTTVNGVKKVVTETTDENGKTTTTSDDDDSNEENKEEENTGGPWVGIRTKELSETLRGQLDLAEDEGVAVDAVASGGPADTAGIAKGDLLLVFSKESVSTSEELSEVISKHKVGETVSATIMRKGERQDVEITLAERPERKEKPRPDDQSDGAGENADASKVFDSLLDNPNVPESFKKSVKEMQEKLREFEKRHGVK